MLNRTENQDRPAGTGFFFTVYLFAGMAKLAGRRQISVQPHEPTVAGIRASLGAAIPQIESLLKRSTVVVDGRYAGPQESIGVAAEIAVIPPVSGG